MVWDLMSKKLINPNNPDLLRLKDEGYAVDVVEGYLVVRHVPYVNSARKVGLGMLISSLELSGDRTNKPSTHVAYWTGEHPCHADGQKITAIENSSTSQDLAKGVRADHTFSAKADYRDYYHKMTTYIGRITGEATKVDPDATAQIFLPTPEDNGEGIFKYIDTASSRANIGHVTQKLAGQRIGIIGLGGTGSYILDLVAKTCVAEIHLFAADRFLQHNAFRAPGAASAEQWLERPLKLAYFAAIYSNLRNGILVHHEFLDESNLTLLDTPNSAFLCLCHGSVKRLIVNHLVKNDASFVDAGMGIFRNDDQLGGIVRAVISTPANRALAAQHISFDEGKGG